jgi:hypothetical protein
VSLRPREPGERLNAPRSGLPRCGMVWENDVGMRCGPSMCQNVTMAMRNGTFERVGQRTYAGVWASSPVTPWGKIDAPRKACASTRMSRSRVKRLRVARPLVFATQLRSN